MDIHNSSELRMAIAGLERKRMQQEMELSLAFDDFRENIKPVNLVKHAFHNIASTPNLSGRLLNAGLGVGIGIVSKKIFMGIGPTNLFKKLAGTILEFAMAGVAAKNSDKIKSVGKGIIHLLSPNRKTRN
jgi:hypothetical protein